MNIIPIKIPKGIFVKLEKLTLKFMWKNKGHRITNKNSEKKRKRSQELHNKIIIETVWYRCTERQVSQ